MGIKYTYIITQRKLCTVQYSTRNLSLGLNCKLLKFTKLFRGVPSWSVYGDATLTIYITVCECYILFVFFCDIRTTYRSQLSGYKCLQTPHRLGHRFVHSSICINWTVVRAHNLCKILITLLPHWIKPFLICHATSPQSLYLPLFCISQNTGLRIGLFLGYSVILA